MIDWKRIETAPKNGKYILLWCNFTSGGEEIHVGRWTGRKGFKGDYGHITWSLKHDGGGIAEKCVTHWAEITPPRKVSNGR